MTNYRIIKLKSSEELIAKISKKEGNYFYLEYPMIFKTMLVPDPYTGTQKELTVLRDWVSNTTETVIKIPDDYILNFTVPQKEACELYDLEKRRKIENKNKKKIKNITKDHQKDMEDLIDKLFNIGPEGEDESDLQEQPPGGLFPPQQWLNINHNIIKDMLDNMDNIEHFEFELTFPPEEINPDETTEEETSHPDYGNRWTDWSSDPNEY